MLLGGFFGMMAVMPVDNFLINMIEGLGGDSSDLGLALFLKAASELPAAFLFEWLYRKIGSQKVLLIAAFAPAAATRCPSAIWPPCWPRFAAPLPPW